LHEQGRNHIKKLNAAQKARASKHKKKMEFSSGDLV